jgi:hypothetical protein
MTRAGMNRRKLGRWIIASTVFAMAMALLVTNALGLGGVDSASVPALQDPSQLTGTVTSQVQVPSVPSAPTVSVPSAPSVSVPSVPTTTSVPSLSGGSRTASGGGSSPASDPSASGPSGPSSSGSGGPYSAPGGPSGSSGGSGPAGALYKSAATPQAIARRQAQQRRQDRRLRREVKSMSGCLGELPAGQRKLLGLRAGLSGPALSQAAAARRLGISFTRAGSMERAGLRSLRGASRSGRCGSTASPQPFSGLVGPGSSTPRLLPAAVLARSSAVMGGAKPAAPARKAPAPASGSSPQSSGSAPPAQAAHTPRTGVASTAASRSSRSLSPALLLALALLLVSFAGVMFLVRRRAWPPFAATGPAEPLSWTGPETAVAVADEPEEAETDAEPALEFEFEFEPFPVAVPTANGNGKGNGNGHDSEPEHDHDRELVFAPAAALHNGNGHSGNGHSPNGNGPNGNGNGHNGHGHNGHNGQGHNGNGAHADRQRVAALAASGIVSLAVTRLVRGRRRRSFYR